VALDGALELNLAMVGAVLLYGYAGAEEVLVGAATLETRRTDAMPALLAADHGLATLLAP